MASKIYKVNEPIEVLYQALNCSTGVQIDMSVYDASHTYIGEDPIVLSEFGTTGRYYGSFTPDTEGDWTVMLQQSNGDGKKSESFSVGTYDLQDIGKKVDAQIG